MQEKLENVKTVIPNGFWETFGNFLNFELISFGKDQNRIVITVGLIILLLVSLFVVKIILRLIRKIYTRKLEPDEKLRFLGAYNFIGYLVYILVFVSVLSSAGIDITLLLTATAVIFIGLGLAMREIFQDIIGGIYIILDKSVQAGDIIEINEKVCKVFDTKLRTTRAVTRDDKVIVIPNHKFVTDPVINYTQNYKNTRQFVKVRVALNADIDKVKKILIEAAKTHSKVLKKPDPFVFFEDFGEDAYLLGIYFFISESFLEPKIKSDIRFTIEKEFRKHAIKFPHPQRDIHFYKTENSD
ncbi:mechanosensitive ion channel domain-containing protein [uncultured Planktosalinus sp.]|uniref:mechanosensitive ion channel family protein n=1 Tax=uncultured Planktosalinus sp. TaxID=1810935 RepID=UPI0030D8525B